MMSVLLALGLLATLLVLRPILAPARVTPQDTRRTELEEERELLLSNLGELQAQGADASALTREKVRLTQVLHELDALPPTPKAGQARPALPVAAATLLGTALLLGIGTVTFFPQWRNLGLSPCRADAAGKCFASACPRQPRPEFRAGGGLSRVGRRRLGRPAVPAGGGGVHAGAALGARPPEGHAPGGICPAGRRQDGGKRPELHRPRRPARPPRPPKANCSTATRWARSGSTRRRWRCWRTTASWPPTPARPTT